MANTIELAKTYVPLLDEVYKLASLSSVLDGASDLARQGANANELIIPKMDMSGLADYSRNSGYVSGDVTLTNETVQCNYDRGIMFQVDTMDDIETAGIAFGRLAGEFIRTKVAPEIDAFRFGEYASAVTPESGTLADGDAVIEALGVALTALDEAEVPSDQRYLFITPTLYNLIQGLESYKSRAYIESFAGVTRVPQTRFNTSVTLGDDGYTTSGTDINFMVIHKPAVIQFEKHVAPKIITPEANQDADAYKFGYRNVGIADVYENKVAGIYCHTAGA